jgi:hypothetical protein
VVKYLLDSTIYTHSEIRTRKDLTTPQGQPIGYTFAKTDFAYGEEPSTTLSHELLEMMGDPDINKHVTVELDKVSKPFQILAGGYIGIHDGDGWTQITAKLPTADKMTLLRPDIPQIEGGGALSLFRTYIVHSEEKFTSKNDLKLEAKRIPHKCSRRKRRSIPRHQWFRSTAHT